MRVVYEPENLIDAHLVKGVLEHAGLPVYLRGEHLTGGAGELPVPGMLALCVPDICEAQARELLAQLARERGQSTGDARDAGFDWIEVPA